MVAGDVCFVDYGEVPQVIHVRLLGCQIDRDLWSIITPDHDIYDEQMSGGNPDFVSFTYGGSGLGAATPPGINPARVYGFGPLSAAEYQQLMMQARVYAAGMRIQLGLPAVPQQAPVPAPVVGGAAADPDPEVWISIENLGEYVQGQIVVSAGGTLPVGHVTLGSNKALIPIDAANALAIKKLRMSEIVSFDARDLRVLPIRFDAQGQRRRDFAEAVGLMSQDKVPGGELQLQGPATTLDVLKGLSSRNLTPITDHERWIRSQEITRNDRSIYEMEVLSRVIEALVMVDQVNLPNLKGGELLLRRWQLIKEAHRISPMAPDYSASDHFMGWPQESGVNPALSKHVSEQLKDQAAIGKEARKAKRGSRSKKEGAEVVAVVAVKKPLPRNHEPSDPEQRWLQLF